MQNLRELPNAGPYWRHTLHCRPSLRLLLFPRWAVAQASKIRWCRRKQSWRWSAALQIWNVALKWGTARKTDRGVSLQRDRQLWVQRFHGGSVRLWPWQSYVFYRSHLFPQKQTGTNRNSHCSETLSQQNTERIQQWEKTFLYFCPTPLCSTRKAPCYWRDHTSLIHSWIYKKTLKSSKDI